MRFDVLSLFPDFVRDTVKLGVVGRAMDRGLLDVQGWNPRDFTEDVHRTVDDRPCGGGPGMVMLIEPCALSGCSEGGRSAPAKVLYSVLSG
jgi:tRNA (guanine37-N1)-methyltransferase